MATNTTYTLTQNNSQGTPAFAQGKVVFDSTSITAADSVQITLGFKPSYVQWVNATDRIGGEYYLGMADDSCVKTAAAGTRTLEVTGGNGGITLTSNGFKVLQNATLGLIAASRTCYFIARA